MASRNDSDLLHRVLANAFTLMVALAVFILGLTSTLMAIPFWQAYFGGHASCTSGGGTCPATVNGSHTWILGLVVVNLVASVAELAVSLRYYRRANRNLPTSGWPMAVLIVLTAVLAFVAVAVYSHYDHQVF